MAYSDPAPPQPASSMPSVAPWWRPIEAVWIEPEGRTELVIAGA